MFLFFSFGVYGVYPLSILFISISYQQRNQLYKRIGLEIFVFVVVCLQNIDRTAQRKITEVMTINLLKYYYSPRQSEQQLHTICRPIPGTLSHWAIKLRNRPPFVVRRAQTGAGIVPLKNVSWRVHVLIKLRLPISAGIVPVNKLAARNKEDDKNIMQSEFM